MIKQKLDLTFWDLTFKKYILFLGIVPMTFGCTYLKKLPIENTFLEEYPQDNFIENYFEDIIEDKIGIQLDFSPGSEEREDRWDD